MNGYHLAQNKTVWGWLKSLEAVLLSSCLPGSPMIGVRDILMNVSIHFRGPCSVQTTGVAHLAGLPNPLNSKLPTPLFMFKRVKKINQCQCLFPFEANKVHTVWPCPTEHRFVPSHSSPFRCPHWPPSSPTCQSQGGVWRLVKTGLPDSTQLRPAWPILWYLTTRLQDTCSFELKCHWGILSACRHLSLTSDFTLVCYKAENIGPWPWRNQTVRQPAGRLDTRRPLVNTQKLLNEFVQPKYKISCKWWQLQLGRLCSYDLMK